MMISTSSFLGSGLLLTAGLWQLTPLKTSGLSAAELGRRGKQRRQA